MGLGPENEEIIISYVSIHAVIVPEVEEVRLSEDSDRIPETLVITKTYEVNEPCHHANAMYGAFRISARAQS